MRDVRLSRSAERDLMRLNLFLATKSPSAARKAFERVATGLKSLESFAERGRAAAGSAFRELIIRFGRDGYVAQYRVEPSVVVVARIFHSREFR